MRPARALVVHAFPVREERTAFAIDCGKTSVCQIVNDRGRNDIPNRWATSDGHDRLIADDVANSLCPGGIGSRRLHAAEVRACANSEYSRCATGSFLEYILRGASADYCVDTALIHRNRSGNDEQVFALV